MPKAVLLSMLCDTFMACLEENLSSLSPSFALSPALPSHSRDDNDCVHLLHRMFVPRVFMNVLAHFKFKLQYLETLSYEKQLSHRSREGEVQQVKWHSVKKVLVG